MPVVRVWTLGCYWAPHGVCVMGSCGKSRASGDGARKIFGESSLSEPDDSRKGAEYGSMVWQGSCWPPSCCPPCVRIWQMDKGFSQSVSTQAPTHVPRPFAVSVDTFSQPAFIQDLCPFSNSGCYPDVYKQSISSPFHFYRQLHGHI
jgi:hypothetical protein